MRFVMRLEFDGSDYCGWQEQSSKMEKASSASLQSTVQKAFRRLLATRKRIHVQGCGRTDAGVHAEEYVANVDIEESMLKSFKGEAKRLRLGLNSHLPRSVSVKEIVEVDSDFHALNDVVHKTYEYRILVKMTKPALDLGRVYWIPGDPTDSTKFDLDLLRKQMKSFEGKKDFAAFANSGHSVKSTIRNILSVTCDEELRSSDRGRLIRLQFTGEGFLKQQVRNMVGALVAVATGKRPVDFIPGLLEASRGPLTRIPSLFCAPPEGLFLLKVNYARPLFPSEA